MPGFVGAALKSFALQGALDSARLALFCRKHGAFMWVYVAVSTGHFYVFLCGSLYPSKPNRPFSEDRRFRVAGSSKREINERRQGGFGPL